MNSAIVNPQAHRNRLVFALAAVILTTAALWFTHRSVTVKQTTWEDVRAEAKAGGYSLIGTDELKKLHEKGFQNTLVADTRQEWEYRTGHIPGAINFPMEPTWWSRVSSGGRLEVALGSDKNRRIIFY